MVNYLFQHGHPDDDCDPNGQPDDDYDPIDYATIELMVEDRRAEPASGAEITEASSQEGEELDDQYLWAEEEFETMRRERSDEYQQQRKLTAALLETARFPSEGALSAARAALSDGDPLVRAAAVRALEALPAPQRYALLESRIADPVRDVRAEVAPLLADVPADELSEPGRTALLALRKEYLVALQHSADMPEGQLNLGVFLQRGGVLQHPPFPVPEGSFNLQI